MIHVLWAKICANICFNDDRQRTKLRLGSMGGRRWEMFETGHDVLYYSVFRTPEVVILR